jgi:hypothetical protein
MFVLDWKQIVELFILAIPVACVARTVVFEEVFREPRQWCKTKSESCSRLLQRKFFYLFTCEYCFSHYVTAFFIIVTGYKLLFTDWRGYLISFFSVVFVANAYLNLYGRLRVEIKQQKTEIEHTAKEIEVKKREVEAKEREIQKLDAELAGTRD